MRSASATHHTYELYGVPFMYPDVRQGPVIAKLNLARAVAREAELAALTAFDAGKVSDDGTAPAPPAASPIAPPARADICLALNRISSALYLLAVQVRRRPLRWQSPPDGTGSRVAPTAMSSTAPSAARVAEKQERLAKVFDTEWWPLYGRRFAQLLLRDLHLRPGTAVLEVGCATGELTLELARRLDEGEPDHRAGAVGAAGDARAGEDRRYAAHAPARHDR